MAIWKATFFFNANQRGWSESWYNNNDSGSLVLHMNRAVRLASIRSGLLGAGAILDAVRVSYEDVKNDSLLETVTLPRGEVPFATLADLDIALLVRARNANGRSHKNAFLRGFPDLLEIDGGKLIGAGAEFAAFVRAFRLYDEELRDGGWGWIGVTAKLETPLLSYVVQPDARIRFTTQPLFFAAGDVGKIRTIRIGFVEGSQRINAAHKVVVTSDSTCVTFFPLAVYNGGTGGRLTLLTYDFIDIEATQPRRIAPRKSGAPLLQPVGRRRGQGRG